MSKQTLGELRSSHFVLGNTSQNSQFTSTMKMNFQKGGQGMEEGLGEKLNVKASHFELGTNPCIIQIIIIYQIVSYNTTFKTHYPPHYNFHPSSLNEQQKHELRTNHFILGKQDGTRVSVTKATHDAKPVQPNIQNEQEEQKIKMRAHHHNFAESENKIMRTYYNEQYQAYPADALKQNKTQAQIMDQVVGLRQSHIILGKERVPMLSVQQADYAKKEGGAQKPVKIALQHSHFALGNQKTDFKTMNQEFLVPQQIEHNPLSLENQQNLRATHFTLGQDNQGYKTETKANFRPYSQNAVEYKNNTRQLQANNFQLGDPRFKEKASSHYNNVMKPPQVEYGNNQSMRDQKMDRGSSFQIGSMPIDYKSEFQSKFPQANNYGQPASLDEKQMKDLRSSHFRFNDVKNNQFLTTTKQSYKGGDQILNNLDPNSEANLRSHHFALGQQDPKYISTMHDVHRPLDGKPNELNKRLAHELRRHHFAFQ